MSDLQNPLFDEEKEFLERKKLEYERALRGDVDHIKDQSMAAGKVALVGAGLAGSVWLIAKAFGGKKRKRKYNRFVDNGYDEHGYDEQNDENPEEDDLNAQYYTAGNGKRYKSVTNYKSAALSAQVFMDNEDFGEGEGREGDNSGFGSQATSYADDEHQHRQPSPFDTEEFEDDPFQDLPYDDSRRLPVSHAFDGQDQDQESHYSQPRSSRLGSMLQAFLESKTGKVLVAQAAAVALAMVTKKVSEFFPADKNVDLATSPGYAPVETGFTPVVSLASPASPDASTHTSSL